MNYLSAIKHSIISTILESRSAVCREGCKLISFMASIMQEQFELVFDFFLKSLFKQVGSAVNVISTYASDAILEIIKFTKNGFSKTIPEIINFYNSKAVSIRLVSLKALDFILGSWSETLLLK